MIALAALAVIGMGTVMATDACVSTFTNTAAAVGTAVGGPVAGAAAAGAGFVAGQLICPNSELNSGN